MSGLSQNAKTLLIIGIVLIVLCAIGVMYQWSVYSEYADAKPAAASSKSFAGALVSWSGSDQAKGERAMHMLVFMCAGCALGAVCVYFALRRKPEPVKPEPEEPREPRGPRKPNSPSYWQ